MRLDIIIVNFNTRELLNKCLSSVFRSKALFAFRVWVVDNASQDGSREMVESQFRSVKLIANQKNLGFSKANNAALRKIFETKPDADFPEYVLLLNSDVEVSTDAFDKMIGFMDNNSAVVISGCKVVKSDGKLDLACRRSFPNPWNAFFRFSGLSFVFPKTRLASYNLTYFPENQIVEVDSVMGAFLLIRTQVMEKIGWLDEDFFMYGEDLDWCYRTKQAGFKVMYVPITTVVHHKGSSSKRAHALALYEFHRSMQLFYDKHYREKYNFFINFLAGIGIWSRYLFKSTQNYFLTEKYVSK